MIEKDINMNGKSKKTVIVCDIFINPPGFNLNFGDGAAGAASHYGSGSTKMMRLLAAPAPQHCKKHNHYDRIGFLNASKQRCGATSFWWSRSRNAMRLR
jgi:hypothetical protein